MQGYERDGYLAGIIRGSAPNSQPLPEDVTFANRHEWVKRDGEWVHDPEEAAKLRAERDDE